MVLFDVNEDIKLHEFLSGRARVESSGLCLPVDLHRKGSLSIAADRIGGNFAEGAIASLSLLVRE